MIVTVGREGWRLPCGGSQRCWGAGGRRGGISAVNSTATTLTQTAVTNNNALLLLGNSGGVYRQGGTMTTTNSPITANTPNNCVGSVPAVPNRTG